MAPKPPTPVAQAVIQLVDLIGKAGLAVASERLSEVSIKVTIKPILGKRGEVEIAIEAPPELSGRRGKS